MGRICLDLFPRLKNDSEQLHVLAIIEECLCAMPHTEPDVYRGLLELQLNGDVSAKVHEKRTGIILLSAFRFEVGVSGMSSHA